MDAAVAELEWRVMETLKASEERGDPPLVRAIEAGRCVGVTAGPSTELGQVLVSLLCFRNNTPSLWKLLDQAIHARLLSPLHILALLTSRVIPHRRAQPEAYRLYLELLGRYGVSLSLEEFGSRRDKITKSIDEALLLSHSYGIDKLDFGQAVSFFLLSVITNLMDSILEDLGIKFLSVERPTNLYANEPYRDLDIDSKRNMNDKMQEHREQLRKTNILMALEVVEKITADKKNKVFFRLIHLNMPMKFNSLMERLQLIEVHRSTSQSLISINHVLVRLVSNIREVVNGEYKLNRHQVLGLLIDSKFGGPTSYYYGLGTNRSNSWISFDLLMENAMDGKHLHAISVVEILTDMTKTLQMVNQACWQETFMALWISALRLVERDREPWEGPIPHLDARLCMLLSIVPLVIVSIVKEELDTAFDKSNYEQSILINKPTSRRNGLVSSLQLLMQYTRLLSPPPSVTNAANNAAAKAAKFIAHFKNESSCIGSSNKKGASPKAVQSATTKNFMSTEESPWSAFMGGAQLTRSLRNALMTTPASSVGELEKLYYTAITGSEEEKSAAAKILCGASLIRGWNIQEHAVHMVVKLLTTPIPGVSGPEICSHLIGHMPMLSAILFGACSVEAIHIISLYGLVPEVAAALMPLCEAFGSVPPQPNHRPSAFDETSVYSVFSCAFLFLLRLWKFYKPPQEHRIAGRGGTVRLEVTLDYLMLLRNHRIAVKNSIDKDKGNNSAASPGQPVYIDSFPKLGTWYLQNKACIASTLSGLCSKSPVHLVANKILNMICSKMSNGRNIAGNPSSTSGSSISESPVSAAEDAYQRPLLPAWDILEAVPFVLEAVLTACANGRLSSRDLVTGLRDLADFLPASLATIVSYFSAEITRGIWEPVAMNGDDWPSPATNLLLVESEIREILASVGVTLPKCYGGGKVPMLPLPMAALVSLTITFKLDKSLEYIHAVVGQALENSSAGSPWPTMPIIGALWAQKVRRWHDFIVLTATRSPFTRDKEAVAQLIRSCFSSFLGNGASQCGAIGLLGQSISIQGLRLPLAPGFLYLRSCRSFHDTHFVNNVILKLVIEWTNELVVNQSCTEPSARLLSGKSSFAAAALAVRSVATLGTSLLCVAGGPLLVQVLYEETLPAALLSWEFSQATGPAAAKIRLLEGYAMAYMLVLSGAFIWGLRKTFPGCSSFSSSHSRAVGMHMEFVAGVLEGEVSVGCDPVTWRTYVSCLLGLLVRFVPSWIPEIRKGTLRKLAAGLRRWNEWELALALLERAGPASMELVMESIL
ncbi:mediator of RNA polymerase II transcription subunit 33A-like isoform X3 [Dendrobium catenatum]|uniref:mediator of RNA polymerase II transcription subunit 33A-like isoform X3 n=1 Tax=Dendrobium catenatum TaxID=906689 RepID=UPI0009F6B79E|nr:mediator of RNA polymerase II transcription subunit 33A-like isoform X3 [Dendrobium catenatum]